MPFIKWYQNRPPEERKLQLDELDKINQELTEEIRTMDPEFNPDFSRPSSTTRRDDSDPSRRDQYKTTYSIEEVIEPEDLFD